MNAPLRQQLTDSLLLHDDPAHLVGKTLHEMRSVIERFEDLHADPMSRPYIENDAEEIEELANRFSDVWYAIYNARRAEAIRNSSTC